MPEQTIIFRNRYEVTEDDLNGMQTNRQDALDHVVGDTIDAGNGYTGFVVTKGTTTSLLIGPGRLYFGGPVYFNDTAPGTELSLLKYLPTTQSKIIAVVVVPKLQSVDLQQRDYEVDTTTQTYEPQDVAVTSQRWAEIQGVAGVEAVQPSNPVLPSSVVVIAYVTMTTDGITRIDQVLENIEPNLRLVDGRTTAVELELASVLPRINTIADDLARLQALLSGVVDETLVDTLARDMGRVKAKLNLPAVGTPYREDDYLVYDASVDDNTYTGYSCKISEGLRFGPENINQTQMAVLNPFDKSAAVSAGGILLPPYVQSLQRIVKDGINYVSLTQYAFQTVSLVQATMSGSRVRYGAEFEEAANSSFFAGGNYTGNASGIASTFQKDGQTFQLYDTGQTNAEGYKVYRVSNYWTDYISTPYWQRTPLTGSAQAYPWAQTFVQKQSGWAVGMSPRINIVPASGAITFGICGTVNGQPDLTNILTQVTLQSKDVVPIAKLGQWIVPLEPTFLQAGQRYAYFVLTQAAYSHQCADIAENAGGTCFYMIDGGVWYPNPSQNLTFDLVFASFPTSQVTVNLAPLSLSGGIASIDILANAIVPANTFLNYEIQVNGVWITLGETDVSALVSLPPLVPFRVTFVGTAYVMPGLTLSGSQVTVSRPKTVLKRGAKPYTPGISFSKVTLKTTLVDFQPAHHTYTGKVLAGGALRTPDITTDVALDARTIERTQVFNLPAAATSYVVEQDGTVDSAANLFHGASLFEFVQ